MGPKVGHLSKRKMGGGGKGAEKGVRPVGHIAKVRSTVKGVVLVSYDETTRNTQRRGGD